MSNSFAFALQQKDLKWSIKMGADFQLLRYVCVDLVQVKHNEGSKIQTQIILFETLAYIKSTHKCNISLI